MSSLGSSAVALMVGQPGFDTGKGAVYILFLNAQGTIDSYHRISASENTNEAFELASEDHFGSDCEYVPDINLDSRDDALISAPYTDTEATDAGCIYLVFLDGGATVLSYLSITGQEQGFTATIVASSLMGWNVAALQDLDQNGITDIAISGPGAGSKSHLLK